MPRIFVVIPAYNEEGSVAEVVSAVRPLVDGVVVADNNSRDATAARAREAGAVVVPAPVQGYGSACLAAIHYVRERLRPDDDDVIAFLDADHCDDPTRLPQLVRPICGGEADLVLGSRQRLAERGAMTPQQVFGNRLATLLIRLIWRHRYTDLGPFRAIRWSSYEALQMRDTNYGWTVEMQIKALRRGLRVLETDVPYRRRTSGQSKISGTLLGTIRAGWKILYVIGRYGLLRR